jgi:hypothetical protein
MDRVVGFEPTTSASLATFYLKGQLWKEKSILFKSHPLCFAKGCIVFGIEEQKLGKGWRLVYLS